MPKQYEIELSFLLSEGATTAEVIQESLAKLHEGQLSKADKKDILLFALNAGHKKEVIKTLREWPDKESYFPWDLFFTTLVKCNEPLSDQEFTDLFKFIEQQKASFFIGPSFPDINPQFDDKLKASIEQSAYQSKKKIRLLWEKLNFVKERGLLEEEKGIIQKIDLFDGDNPKLPKAKTSLEKRLAESLVLQQTEPFIKVSPTDINGYKTKLSPIEIDFCRNLSDYSESIKSPGDRFFFDLAILFHQIEAYGFALNAIQKAPECLEKKWLELEFLFLTTRHFECIELAEQLMNEFPESPDVNFACLYQKSLCQWAIGTHEEAIEIMKAIVNTRPNYRSSYQILHSWMESQR